MRSILVIIRGLYRNHIKCIYLKNQTLFLHSLLPFQNLYESLNILQKKKKKPHSVIISEVIHSKKGGYLSA